MRVLRSAKPNTTPNKGKQTVLSKRDTNIPVVSGNGTDKNIAKPLVVATGAPSVQLGTDIEAKENATMEAKEPLAAKISFDEAQLVKENLLQHLAKRNALKASVTASLTDRTENLLELDWRDRMKERGEERRLEAERLTQERIDAALFEQKKCYGEQIKRIEEFHEKEIKDLKLILEEITAVNLETTARLSELVAMFEVFEE
ncbi:hypothetical protein TL16_g04047 [Triparma laevis f. inornata]|uniref:Uncharacterized protein n=1 Tax=Triparma laevis f. inornata TaxID=1714386 RepID=A0A9W7E3V8_9STRA|nr:hypothetical protein TL16_g04047 [Triparma laevis f. inornata]